MKKLQSYFVLLWIICLLVTSCRQSGQSALDEAAPTQQAVITPVPTYTPTVQSVVQQGDSGSVAHEENAVASGDSPVQASTSPTATTTATRQPTATATRRPTAVPTPEYYVSGSANLRSGPGTNYDIVGGRQPNDVLAPIARTEDGEWIQIDSKIWIWSGLVEGEVASLPVTHDLPEPTLLPSTADSVADLDFSLDSDPLDFNFDPHFSNFSVEIAKLLMRSLDGLGHWDVPIYGNTWWLAEYDLRPQRLEPVFFGGALDILDHVYVDRVAASLTWEDSIVFVLGVFDAYSGEVLGEGDVMFAIEHDYYIEDSPFSLACVPKNNNFEVEVDYFEDVMFLFVVGRARIVDDFVFLFPCAVLDALPIS